MKSSTLTFYVKHALFRLAAFSYSVIALSVTVLLKVKSVFLSLPVAEIISFKTFGA